ncbi:unnamed protein product [Effrenium voratum]|nr:unnamed protein product [Effrenium voratum]
MRIRRRPTSTQMPRKARQKCFELEKTEDRWPSVLLLTGAWACAMSVFASAVVTLSLAASPVAPPGAETLPLALALVFQGVANLVLPAEKRCLGLKGAYVLGAVIGFLGCGLVGLGCWVQQFGLQLFGAACMGFSLAHAQNYRFSAVLMLPSNPPKAIGVVLFGGVVGSMTGSAGFTQAKHMLPVEFAGIYVLGAGAHTVALVILACMSFPPVPGSTGDKARSLGQLLRQPRCAAAVLAMASSYGMMLVLMAPSPVVMQRFYSIPYVPNTLAMMGHMACMFSPSLITGSAVNRYGPMKVIMLGVLLGFSCALLLWCFGLLRWAWLCWASAGTSCSWEAPRCWAAPTKPRRR